MKVFVLTAGKYDDEWTVGVFSSVEKLEEFKKNNPRENNKEYHYQDYKLDYSVEVYCVFYNSLDGKLCASETTLDKNSKFVGKVVYGKKEIEIHAYVLAEDEKDAIKKGSELLSLVLYEDNITP